MKLTFNLDPNNIIECKWTLLTGLEIYKLNNTEFFRTRSFKLWGSSQFEVNANGEKKTIQIHLKFRPSFRSLFQSSSFVAQVYIDGELFIDNLLTSQYHHKNIFIKTLDNVALILSLLFLILVIAVAFFSTELFPLPESGKIRIAALATPECLAAYPEMDRSMIPSEQVAIELRKDEMNRKQSWVPSGGLSVFAIITNGYG